MKSVLSLLFILLSCVYVNAEPPAQDMRDGRHIFNYSVSLPFCDFNGVPDTSGDGALIQPDIVFVVRFIIPNGNYVIQLVKFKGSGTNNITSESIARKPSDDELNRNFYNDGQDNVYMLLTQQQYNQNAQRLAKKGSFNVGGRTNLIKWRPGKKKMKDGYRIYSEIDNDINIGVTAGWKIAPNRRKDQSHSFMFGVSGSSIKATAYTTKDFVTAETAVTCVTFSLGYIFELNKFQFSLFTGIDAMPGEIGNNWIYKNRPWVCFGFGYEIFRDNDNAPNTTVVKDAPAAKVLPKTFTQGVLIKK